MQMKLKIIKYIILLNGLIMFLLASYIFYLNNYCYYNNTLFLVISCLTVCWGIHNLLLFIREKIINKELKKELEEFKRQ